MRMQFRNHKSAQWTKLPRYCSQVFTSFCRYRKGKDELIDVEEVARKMEPRARVELATCRLRIEPFSSISFAVYLRPSLPFAPFRPHLPASCATVCAMPVVGQFPITLR